MPSLKDYRDRIASVKSTKKITSAMKMVAASKLKKAQEAAQASQPYAVAMADMLARVAAGVQADSGPKLLSGTGSDKRHLLVVFSSDRGLCGGFNGNLVRKVRAEIAALKAEGKDVKLLVIGRKAKDLLKRDYADMIVKSFTDVGNIEFSFAAELSDYIQELFDQDAFDVCSMLYNDFRSVLAQVPTSQQLIPFTLNFDPSKADDRAKIDIHDSSSAPYGFEPEEEKILADLLPRNISVQIFRSLLDNAAGEQAARMTAMDNATRNAGDMIKRITLEYNRARQAYITKELIEIISGAEAL